MNGASRLAALFLSFAFGIIGLSVGINSLVKSNNLKSFVKAHAPTGVSVNINNNDVFQSGVVVTVGCVLLAITSAFTMLFTLLRRSRASRKPHIISAFLHFFWSIWIFASLIAYDVIARNRQAKVTASLGNIQLPDSTIQQQEQALGVTPVYWKQSYIRLLAILPWFAVLFGVVAGVLLLRASRTAIDTTHASRDAVVADQGIGGANVGEKEMRRSEAGKMSMDKRDVV